MIYFLMATLTSITTRPILTNDVEAKILRVFLHGR